MQTAHKIASFRPALALGSTVDKEPAGSLPSLYSTRNVRAMLDAGYGWLSYRLFTELVVQDWHWNPAGTFSQGDRGYWTSSAHPSRDEIVDSYGYRLPHRGFTTRSGRERGLLASRRRRYENVLEEQPVPEQFVYRRTGSFASAVGDRRSRSGKARQRGLHSLELAVCYAVRRTILDRRGCNRRSGPRCVARLPARQRSRRARRIVHVAPVREPVSRTFRAGPDDRIVRHVRFTRQRRSPRLPRLCNRRDRDR